MKVTSIFKKLFDSEFDENFNSTLEQEELLDEIVSGYYDSEDICELLFSRSPEYYDPDKFASFLSLLFWRTPDNGAKMFPILEKWAVSENKLKVSVTYSKELEVVLNNVKKQNSLTGHPR